MSNFYEILVIVSPDETDEGVDAVTGGLRQQLAASGGEVVNVERWGRRKLAYPIGKHAEGVYLLIHVKGDVALPAAFRGYTKIRESILREMVVRLTETHETAIREALLEKGPEDQALATAQMEAAEERAAAKRAEAATSVSDREEATESPDAAVDGDETGVVAEPAAADEPAASDVIASDDTDDESAADTDDESAADTDDESAADTDDESVADTDDESVADTDDESVADTDDESVADTDDESAVDTDEEPEAEALSADDSPDDGAEHEPGKED